MIVLADLLICLRFFSRLPVPATEREIEGGPAALSQAVALIPVAGALIGIVPALVLLVALSAGLPPVLAAPLAIATQIAVTGALHEDGLADCADGFGGGRTQTRKLEIMRDSRIGTFGACAIALSLYLRATALGILAAHAPGLAAATIVAAAAVSRTACLLPAMLLPAARVDGLGAKAGHPSGRLYAVAAAIAFGVSLTVVPWGTGLGRQGMATAFAFGGALAVSLLARRQIGGQTGDVAGAAQQVAETAFLLVLAAARG